MSHPSTISKNTLKVYHNENIPFKPTKRILSINLYQWKEKLPKRLNEICIETIAFNWEVLPIINELPLISDVISLLDILKTDLPLELTVPKIAYDSYWLRCYKERWPKNLDVDRNFSEVEELTWTRKEVVNIFSDCKSNGYSEQKERKRKTWKELYLEMHVQEYLENLEPEDYNIEKIKNLYVLCKEYVRSLKIRELRAPTCMNIPDHIPLSLVLMGFSNLKELSLCFKQKYVGEKFSWHIFNTTMVDIKNLSKGLENSKLEILRIQNSDINCTKIKMILKSLDDNEKLKELEFSHCKIADHGAMAISNFVKHHVNVSKLNLVNNYIGYEGIKSLAFILMEDDHLINLNVRLNIINSKGGKYLFYALAKGKNSLKELNLSGCGLNSRNVEIEEMLRNNITLEKLNLSNNRMGKEIEKLIIKGLQFNTTLTNIDCRRCDFSSDLEVKISDICEKNKRKIRSKDVCWDPPEYQFQEGFEDIFSLEFQNDFYNILSD